MILEILNKKDNSFNKNHAYIIAGFTIFYALWCTFIIDVRFDHLLFYLLIFTCMTLHHSTRKFALSFVFFIIFWIFYDGLRAFPNYMVNPVHSLEPYNIEKWLFGINTQNGRITLNEYFSLFNHPGLDITTALFYLTWVPIPLTLAFYLYRKDKTKLLKFTGAYLFTNLVGFVIYYTYPAAPPWYFAKYGEVIRFDIPSSAAGLLKFDQLINYPLFENLYTKNSNVFAAIPSLHAAYPVVTWYYARNNAPKWLVVIIFIDIIGIWFSAVYSYHHYFIDVLLGGLVAVFSIFIFEKFIFKSKFSIFISNFAKFIELK